MAEGSAGCAGPTHPWTRVVADKVAAVQARIQACGVKVGGGPGACGLCGETQTLDGQPLKRCDRCAGADYCCVEHQRVHWPVHKGGCAARGK